VLLGALVVRPRLDCEGFVHRDDEEAVGRAAASAVPAGERCLVEVADYGYLAAIAAFGRPEDAIADRSLDPRLPAVGSSFDDAGALAVRIGEAGAGWILARRSAPALAGAALPVAASGAWALWRLTGSFRVAIAPGEPAPLARKDAAHGR
jgi:hypothetical protein